MLKPRHQKDYRKLEQHPQYIPFSADALKQMWKLHERSIVDWEGYKSLEKALTDTLLGNQPILIAASSPVVLLNIDLVKDLISEHRASRVCYEGMNHIGWILKEYSESTHITLPVEPNEAMNQAYLDGKVLPAYVGSDKVALESFHNAYKLVINTTKKALSKNLI